MAMYTLSMAKKARNMADLIRGEYGNNTGRVHLGYVASVVGMPRTTKGLLSAFYQWYADVRATATTPVGKLMAFNVISEPPLMVAAYLNEFANAVDGIVALANTLQHAADAILKYGFIQGETGNKYIGLSMHAALDLVVSEAEPTSYVYVHREQLFDVAIKAIREHLGTSLLVDWNDAPGRTARDVVDVFQICATSVLYYTDP